MQGEAAELPKEPDYNTYPSLYPGGEFLVKLMSITQCSGFLPAGLPELASHYDIDFEICPSLSGISKGRDDDKQMKTAEAVYKYLLCTPMC